MDDRMDFEGLTPEAAEEIASAPVDVPETPAS